MFSFNHVNRRTFLRTTAAAAGSLALRPFGLMPALAQSVSDYRALVCVFLFGGNDSNNTVIPMDDASYKAYTSIRGGLALTGTALAPTITDVNGAPFAFHAKLAEVSAMFASRELAVVANAGPLVQPLTRAQYQAQQLAIPSNLFSHSDQQQLWQTSIAQGRSATGWAGRVADYAAAQKWNTSPFPTFFSTAGNSLMGNGAQTQPVAVAPGQSLQMTGFNSSAASQTRYNAMTSLLTLDSGVALSQAANHVLSNSIVDASLLTNALAKATALKTVFPTTSIGNQLKQVAQVIQVHADLGMNRQIFFVSLGGFDTHAGQINTQVNLYGQLSAALAAFRDATHELVLAPNVTAFTESDFGRTFQSTSGDGSDHAWGSHHLVMGGAVKGGQVFGKFPAFQLGGPDDTDTRGRWIPTTSVDQYGATLASWFGVPDAALPGILPNLANFATPTSPTGKLGFLG